MNDFELYTLIFFALDNYWDENKDEDLGQFLSGMNPFLFSDIGSAVPDIYIDYKKSFQIQSVAIEESYELAKDYIESLGKDYITKAFAWVEKNEWEVKCREYLSTPHKGGNYSSN